MCGSVQLGDDDCIQTCQSRTAMAMPCILPRDCRCNGTTFLGHGHVCLCHWRSEGTGRWYSWAAAAPVTQSPHRSHTVVCRHLAHQRPGMTSQRLAVTTRVGYFCAFSPGAVRLCKEAQTLLAINTLWTTMACDSQVRVRVQEREAKATVIPLRHAEA